MVLPSTYSRRKREAASNGADVYQYDSIPKQVRVQIIHNLREAFKTAYHHGEYTAQAYEVLVNLMREEKGVHRLSGSNHHDEEFLGWFELEASTDVVLDALELALRLIDTWVRDQSYYFEPARDPDEVIARVNARLAEASIGYRYEGGQIVRIDSEHIHREVVLPALTILRREKFAGANSEYRAAHAAYREGDYETCLIECGKAFESVLKVIGADRNWGIKETDAAARLLAAAYDAGFVPLALQAEFNALRSLLESGVPVLRNKMSGHGTGRQPREVPAHFAALQLHQTASAIVFLAAQDEALPA